MVLKPRTLRKLVLLAFTLCIGILVNAQTRTIQGKVSDKSGEMLIGASVSVPGTTVGAMTDVDGNFTLTVPQGATTLQVSMIGYATATVTIGGSNTIDVVMELQTTSLDEIVVIGYGTVKKRDLTGAVSSVKSDEITKVATSNAMQSIQGKVAGLDIRRESGETGSGIKMDLRGVRSINATNEPLYLVDGIEYGSTLDINSSDIASIEVLKDASSTAIYGTKGANGVIIITTKRGTQGAEKSTITFNSYLSINKPAGVPDLMNVEQEYRFLAERQRYAAENVADTWGSTNMADYTPEVVLSNVLTSPYEKTVLQLYKEGGTDWFDLIMRNGITQNYELSVASGSDKTSFNVSVGYMDENGLLRNDELKRYNTRINIDHNVSKRIKIGSNMQFTYRDWDRRDDGVYNQILKMHALSQPYYDNGSILDKPSELATSHTNPLLNEVEGYYSNNTKQSKVFGNLFASWEIVKGLQFKSVFGVNATSTRIGEYEDFMCTGNYQSGRGSFLSSKSEQSIAWTWDNTLNYTLNIGSSSAFEFLAGTSAQKSVRESHMVSGYGKQDHYGATSFYFLGNIASRALEDVYYQTSMLSYFGRANYKLLGKYLLTATIRTDGASVLYTGNKWDYFPSLAAAWVISDESFMSGIDNLDQLKLRVSWGKAGSSAINAYQTRTILGTDPVYYSFNGVLYTGYVPGTLGNPDVTWETTSTYDAGLDFSIFKERVTGTMDFYYSNTFDLLFNQGLPASSVYPQVMANVSKTKNIGFETSLNFRVINKKDFSWNSDVTFSANKDEIVSLTSGADRDYSIPTRALKVGEGVRCYVDYEANGCWSISEASTAALYGKVPGDVKIVDAVNDTTINSEDRRLYNTSPRIIFGWTNNFVYKNFTLSAQLYGRLGQYISYDLYNSYRPTEPEASPVLDYWTPENQGAMFPRPGIASQNELSAISYVKASYLKIREITLGYNLPQSLISKAGISNMRVYGSLQNYFTFSKLDNYDPERGGAISNPMTKQMVFGVNLQF